MRDDLVPVEIEIDPLIRAAAFGATQQFAIELARGGDAMDGKREMERRQGGVRNAHDVELAVDDAMDDRD
jgi:hypothetical protein